MLRKPTGHGLKLIMAVSADGFVASGPRDDMRWTGFTDKQVFRLLTASHPILLVGRKTAEVMPPLPHRRVVPLSRDRERGMTLYDAAMAFPGAWLGGGAETAREALESDLVEVTYLCRTTAVLGGGISVDPIRQLLPASPRHTVVLDLTCTVEVFQHGP